MAVNSKHPDWSHWSQQWEMMRHCEQGEHVVKEKQTTYLPMPSGFTQQQDSGAAMYGAYMTRARFPDVLQPTLGGMVGVIHRVEAQVTGLEKGKPLEFMLEKCTKDGMPLEHFHRMITTEILLQGRYGILTDAPSDPAPIGNDNPCFFVGYGTEYIINWSKDRNLFVLDETRLEQGGEDEFNWEKKEKYRVLRYRDGKYSVQPYEQTAAGEVVDPTARGGKAFDHIPFVVAGPRFLTLDVEQPPLIGVAQAALAMYRLDADYRHQLYNSGQETFVIIGDTETLPRVLGSGVTLGLPKECDAKYVGPNGAGIAAHRIAIMDERQSAVAAGVRLFDTQAKAESGEALRLRGAAQTASLMTVATASAAALEAALRNAAIFVGQDPLDIVVKPNLDFVDTVMTGDEATKLVTVWQSGAISKQTLYEALQRGEIASGERSFDEEQALIEAEAVDDPTSTFNPDNPQNKPIPVDPNNPDDPNNPNNKSRFKSDGKDIDVQPGK